MAVLTVTNTNDSGPGSLRQALIDAEPMAGADTVTFSGDLAGQTIALASALAISFGTVTIDGDLNDDGVPDITLSGNNAVRHLSISGVTAVTLEGLKFLNGRDVGSGPQARAGSILSASMVTLTVVDSIFQNNYAAQQGLANTGPAPAMAGAIWNAGSLNISDTVFYANTALGADGTDGVPNFSASTPGGQAGGGIVNGAGGILRIRNVAFDSNTAFGGDGGNSDPNAGNSNGGNGGDAAGGILNLGTIVGQATHSISSILAGQGGTAGLPPRVAGRDGYANPLLVTIGTTGDDLHRGLAGDELYVGGFGNDTATGGAGLDILYGEAGNDTLTGDGSDQVSGGADDDVIRADNIAPEGLFDGGAGNDSLDLSRNTALTGTYDLAAPGGFTTSAGGSFLGFEHIVATRGAETILGTAAANRIDAGGGNDTVQGNGGSDTIDGGAGNDTLTAAGGSTVRGGDDDDVLIDTLVFDGTFDGGAGIDTIDFSNDPSMGGTYDLNLAGGFTTVFGGIFANFENIVGARGAETMIGTPGANSFDGGRGNDTLIGGGGNDTLKGGAGADQLTGGDGDDTYINPAAGSDTIAEAALPSGAGVGLHDKIVSSISVSLSAFANVEDITLIGNAAINAIGSNAANILIGNLGANTLNGGGGNDTLEGGRGADTLNGGQGADLFRFDPANTGADRIDGFETIRDRFDMGGGTFTARVESGGDTTLTHGGGTILVTGIVGLSLAQWKALIVSGAREAPAHHDAAHSHAPLGHFGAADFLYA